MRVLLAGLAEVGISGIFISEHDEDVSGSDGQHVVVEAVPLATHHWERIFELLLVNHYPLLLLPLQAVQRWRRPVVVGGDHLRGVPQFVGGVLHTGEDESVGEGIFLSEVVPSYAAEGGVAVAIADDIEVLAAFLEVEGEDVEVVESIILLEGGGGE